MVTNKYENDPVSLMEAARLIGMDKNRACRWARKGLIRAAHLPTGRYLVTEDEIQRIKELLSGRQSNT